MSDEVDLDKGNVTVIGHISIRDPDSGEVIVRQRDIAFERRDESRDC